MKLKSIIVAAFAVVCTKAHAQSFAINTTGATAHNSAILDITSTSKGVLVPRVSTAQRTAIVAPAKGLMVYDSTVNQFAYYDGTAWLLLNAGGSSWTVSGSHQYSNVTGNVGIGTAAPTTKLHVIGNGMIANAASVNTGTHALVIGEGVNNAAINSIAAGTNTIIETGYGHSIVAGFADTVVASSSAAFGYRNKLTAFTTFAAGDNNKVSGQGGAALGTNNIVSGGSAFSSGTGNTVSGSSAFSSGTGNTVSGNTSAAFGNGNMNAAITSIASGTNVRIESGYGHSIAVGFADTVAASSSAVFGFRNKLTAFTTFAAGDNNKVSGQGGTAFGGSNLVAGSNAFAAGQSNIVNGNIAFAGGVGNTAPSFAETELGMYAADYAPISTNSYSATDRIFNIGNGSSSASRSNAFTILKNGNTGIGTAAPSEKLEVAGKTKTTNMQLTNGAVAGYVLQSDAAGNATWIDPTSIAITETDPQVSAATVNRIPKWNGTALVDGLITDNGTNVGIGTLAPAEKLHIKGSVRLDSARLSFVNTGNSVFIGEKAGQVDNLTDNRNVYIGFEAGSAGTTNQTSVAIGYQALKTAVSASSNIAIGHRAMGDFTSGVGNLATGNSALEKLTSGTLNTALGNDVLAVNTTGIHNTAVGGRALTSNATGEKNTVLGTFAGFLCAGSGNVFLGFSAGYYESGSDKLYIDNSNTTTPLIYGDFSTNVLTVNGNMGIGTANPIQAKLVINGSQSQTFASYGYLNRTHPTGTINGNTTANDYSIYATDRIAAPEFNAYSDARIKNIKGISNSKADLQTLMGIEITDYQLKDTVSKGNHVYKKVIAQQVEKVYPQAVSKMTDVVPDIYKLAEMQAGKIILPNTMQKDDKVKLIFETGEILATVVAADAKGFTVDAIKTGKVFVYGKQVSDFRSVDYEAISMLNVSATQQLVKQLQVQDEQLRTQQAQINELTKLLQQLQQDGKVTTLPGR